MHLVHIYLHKLYGKIYESTKYSAVFILDGGNQGM